MQYNEDFKENELDEINKTLSPKESSYLHDDCMEEEDTFNENTFRKRKMINKKYDCVEDENAENSVKYESCNISSDDIPNEEYDYNLEKYYQMIYLICFPEKMVQCTPK